MDGGKSWIWDHVWFWLSLVLLIQVAFIFWDQTNIEMDGCTLYTAYHVRPESEINDT